MHFRPVTLDQPQIIEKIYQAYLQAFPEDERRSPTQYQALYLNPSARVYLILQEENEIGYFITWAVEDFIFIEHFEIFPEARNSGLGSKVLAAFGAVHPKIILESEPANLNDIAQRRIHFYLRNNFKVLTKDYQQPTYQPHNKPVPLWLLGNYAAHNTQDIVAEIYRIVYQQEGF